MPPSACVEKDGTGLFDQHGVVALKVFFDDLFAGQRDRSALGVALEKLIVDEHLADNLDMKIGALHLPDLTIFQR